MRSGATLLARNIALRNPQVADEAQLNYAVQMTIDRIIFLRICEDRGIEPEEQLKNAQQSHGHLYRNWWSCSSARTRNTTRGCSISTRKKAMHNPADTFTPGLEDRRQGAERDHQRASIIPARTSSRKSRWRSWGRCMSSFWARSSG